MTPRLVVLSSPSGAGKTTIAERLLARRTDVGRSISATTRAPRSGEADGRDYYFVTPADFARREAAGEFLESATYGGNRYGTLRSEVERLRREGKHALLVIEVAGARQVRRAAPEAGLVFVLPPSGAELVRRLMARNTERPEVVRRRLEIAGDELGAAPEYDWLLLNDQLEQAVTELGRVLDGVTVRTGREQAQAESDRLRAEIARELERLGH